MKNSVHTEDSFFSYRRTYKRNISEAHYHYNYEIYYLINGAVRYIIEDEIWDLKAGDMVLIPKMTTHKSIRTPGSNTEIPTERYLISLKGEDIPNELISCFEKYFYRPEGEAGARIRALFDDLYRERVREDKLSPLSNQANLIKILCELSRMPLSDFKKTPLSKNDLLMQDAIDYIKKHLEEDLTLSFMAKHFAFSKEYFSTIFKISTGFGFNEYLNQMRIAKVSHLLTETDKSVTEISSLCGFNDSNYFSAVFKKIMGITPLKYRQSYKIGGFLP